MKALKLLVIIIVLFLLGFNTIKAQKSNLELFNPNIPKAVSYVIKVETGDHFLPEKLLNLFEVFDIEQKRNNNTYFLGQYRSKSKAELFKHSIEVSGVFEPEIIHISDKRK